MDEYQIGDEICCSKNKDCTHVYHAECMIQWLMKHDECPLCRADYLKVSDDSIVDVESGARLEFPDHRLDSNPNSPFPLQLMVQSSISM